MHQLKDFHIFKLSEDRKIACDQIIKIIEAATIIGMSWIGFSDDMNYINFFNDDIRLEGCRLLDEEDDILISYDEFLARLKGEWKDIKVIISKIKQHTNSNIIQAVNFSVDVDEIPEGEYLLTKVYNEE